MKSLNLILFAISVIAVSSLVLSANVAVFSRPNLKISDTTLTGSTNWAGYAETGTYTSASAKWTVPTITSSSTTGYSAAWVGIGGFNGNTVIQTGTEQDCLTGTVRAGEMRWHGIDDMIVDKSNSIGMPGGPIGSTCTPTYYAWWELYPQNSEQQIPSCTTKLKTNCITVSPGDVITASVTKSPTSSSWTLTITDSNGQKFLTTQKPNFTPDLTSTEAIVERPALCSRFSCTLTNLADFGTINFQSASGIDNNAYQITMVSSSSSHSPLVTTSPLPLSGTTLFSVTWLKSS